MGRNSLRLVFLAAAVLALYGVGLEHTPPHLHHDEAVISLQAHSIATTGRNFEGRLLPLYFHMPHVEARAWFQPMIVYVTALFLQVLPAAAWSFRFPTAVIATVNVLLMFLVARRLFGSDKWGWIAAILLAVTPTHLMLGRVAFDYIYPLPFLLGWLLALLVYLDRREPWRLFLATAILGVGFYSFIASVVMMPLYLAMTIYILLANGRLTTRTAAIAAAGFAVPLLPLVVWVVMQPSFVSDILTRYSLNGTGPRIRPSAIAERVSLYWTFFNPAFLFLMGGFTHLFATTRLVGVFLLPFIVLIPLGLVQMVTQVRTATSVVIAAGFALAPLAAVLTVDEPYASFRQLGVMVFGVLIAVYGLQRAWSWQGRLGRLVAIGVTVLLPLHFAFFAQHYFGAYRGYSAAAFGWNRDGALDEIIDREVQGNTRPVFLSAGHDRWMSAYWQLALARKHRPDLLEHATFFDAMKPGDVTAIPAGALVLVSVDDKALLDGIRDGRFTEVARVAEPADDPVFFILRRNP